MSIVLRLKTIDEDIRAGKGSAARATLIKLAARRVPRVNAADFAQYCWRADLPALGLRVLHPIVRPPPKSPRVATPIEAAEYAMCLIKHGAVDEGLGLLAGLNDEEVPRVLLYKHGGLVAQWNYKETISLLRRYLKSKGLEPYQEIVAKVNLTAALIYERQPLQAEPLLRDLLYVGSLRGFGLVLGKTMELTAENYIIQKKWDDADAFLSEAGRRLETSEGMNEFFVRKFKAEVAFRRSSGNTESRALIANVREEAWKRSHWETVRDCDRTLAVTDKDTALLGRLYFGTPYAHYQQRLLEEFGPIPGDLLKDYLWVLRGKPTPTQTFDLFTGGWGKQSERLKQGALLHRVLVALCADFYRPIRTASLFAKVYPDRLFNPTTSPPLVYDALARLRTWCREEKIPLQVEETDSFYRLSASAPAAIALTSNEALGKKHGLELGELKKKMTSASFSLGDALKILPLPRRSLLRLLQEAVEEGALRRMGVGRNTRYQFA